MTIDTTGTTDGATGPVERLLAAVRKAGDDAEDDRDVIGARQIKAGELGAQIAAIPPGSPDGQRLAVGLRALGVSQKSIDASIQWHREQKRSEARSSVKGWQARLLRDHFGNIESVCANAITILRCDPAWARVLAWDDFAQAIAFRAPPPWFDDDAPATDSGVLDDYNTPALSAWLARAHGLRLSDEIVYKAARTVAMGRGRRFDSLRDWLDSLVWDRVPRVERWLTTYFAVPDSPYVRFVGRAWLVSCAARGYVPGAQVDHTLVVEGLQGEGKTSALRDLVGDRFSDSPLPLHDKDRFVNLRGVWVQSFDELASLGKADANAVKNYLTARVDIFRPPYARDTIKVSRRTVFAGTINPRPGVGYLKDDTGARRFWPVRCDGPLDVAALRCDREQLWAEAVHLYQAGVKWHPETTEQRTLCRGEQEERQDRDVWEEPIRVFLEEGGRQPRDEDDQSYRAPRAPLDHVTVELLLTEAVRVPVRDQDARAQGRVASVMAGLGWSHERRTVDGLRLWRYHRPAALELEMQLDRLRAEAARLRAEATAADEKASRVALQLQARRDALASQPATA